MLLHSLSYYVSFLENADKQANMVLFIAVIPLVWNACAYYYKKGNKTHGNLVGKAMLLTSVTLLQADVKAPFVDTNDIADVAVKALLNDEHNEKIYQLIGP